MCACLCPFTCVVYLLLLIMCCPKRRLPNLTHSLTNTYINISHSFTGLVDIRDALAFIIRSFPSLSKLKDLKTKQEIKPIYQNIRKVIEKHLVKSIIGTCCACVYCVSTTTTLSYIIYHIYFKMIFYRCLWRQPIRSCVQYDVT